MKQAGDAPVLTSTIPATTGNTRKPLVKGTAPTGSTVRLYSDDACAGPVVGTGSAGDLASYGIALTVDVAENATTRLFAQATDAEDNKSVCSNGIDYTHDGTPPAAPQGLSFVPTPPANNNAPRIKGTIDAGTISVFVLGCGDSSLVPTGLDAGTTPAGTLVVSGSAADFASSGLSIGSSFVNDDSVTTFYVMASDTAGNNSGCATATYTEDSTRPDVPSALTFTPTPPASDNRPVLRGQAEANTAVKVYTSYCGGNLVGEATAALLPDAGIQIPQGVIGNDETIRFYVRAIDDAGNTSEDCATINYTNDKTPPAAPTSVVSVPASPSPSATLILKGAVGADVLDVRVYVGACDAGAAAIVSGSAEDFSSTGFGIDAGVITLNGATTFLVEALDNAKNPSACASYVYLHDNAQPPTPSVPVFVPAPPANNNIPKIQGTAEADASVKISKVTCGASDQGIVVATSPGGTFSRSVTADTNATTRFYVQAVDPSQNQSLCSSIDFVHDSTAPVPPGGLTTSPASPSWDTKPYVKGTSAETASTIAISKECNTDAGQLLAMGAAADFLTSGILVDGGLTANATNTLYVMSIDPAQNRSSCATVSYVHDSIAPGVVAASLATNPASPSFDPRPYVKGTVDAGAHVRIVGRVFPWSSTWSWTWTIIEESTTLTSTITLTKELRNIIDVHPSTQVPTRRR